MRPASSPVSAPANPNSAAAARGGPAVQVWTDGACKGNPGVGGWGALLRWPDRDQELFGGEAQTTNNRMELTAVIRALDEIQPAQEVVVHTDSQYVQLGITEWMAGWVRRGWRTAANQPVKNDDLWRQLSASAQRHKVQWRWVRGHDGNEGNERADALANRGVASVAAAGRGRA